MQATESSEVRKSHVDGVPNVGKAVFYLTPGLPGLKNPKTQRNSSGFNFGYNFRKNVNASPAWPLRLGVLEAGEAGREITEERNEVEMDLDSDDTFAFIAGYTPAGFAYGTTWEELGELPPWADEELDEEESK